MNPPLTIEAATPADLDALVCLERRAATHPWTRAHFAAALGHAGTRVLVVRAAAPGALRALCVLVQAADEVELHEVVVAPEERRRGLARALLERGLADAARGGARTAFLEVRASNQTAQALYARLGFVASGRRRAYYAAPLEDALVLRRILEFPRVAC